VEKSAEISRTAAASVITAALATGMRAAVAVRRPPIVADVARRPLIVADVAHPLLIVDVARRLPIADVARRLPIVNAAQPLEVADGARHLQIGRSRPKRSTPQAALEADPGADLKQEKCTHTFEGESSTIPSNYMQDKLGAGVAALLKCQYRVELTSC